MFRRLLVLISLSWSSFAFAQNPSGAQAWPSRTRIGFVYGVFGGERFKAITNKSTAVGAEVGIMKGASRFGNLVGKIRGLHISGKEDFLDGTTEYSDVSYTLFATEPAIGLHLNLMPYYPPGVRAYLLALGIMSYEHIRLDKAIDFQEINNSDTAIGFGYELGAGLEWNFKREKGLWSMWGEIQYRQVTVKLIGQDKFQLTGLQMVGGISW